MALKNLRNTMAIIASMPEQSAQIRESLQMADVYLVYCQGSKPKRGKKDAYAATEWVTFENKYMRHDIGKAIDDVEA